ncbi:MAG TPA: hypothetical protein VLM79_39810 [Kofleriaceae bacterium]|nr:hypothetical protein [Kofleriaceae bacterium]
MQRPAVIAVLGVLGVAAGCSTPASDVGPRRPPPVAEGSADRDGDPPHAPRPADPPPPPPETFPWQETRDWYDQLRATPVGSTPCDFRARRPSQRGEVECLPPGGPARMAARARIVGAPTAGQVQLVLDLGTDDAITAQWVGALLDDAGHALSPWAHPERLGPHVAFLTVDIAAAAAEGRTRVGLRKDMR